MLKQHSLLFSPLASAVIEIICLKRLRGVESAIQLLDYYMDRVEQRFVLVLEFPVPCFTLHDCLVNYRQPPPDISWKAIIVMIANALMEFKDRGVVYGELEPSNVLFCVSSGRIIVKLLDFEACTDVVNGRYSEIGSIYPQPYRSPEQDVDPKNYDREAAQVYALGSILDEMVRKGFVKRLYRCQDPPSSNESSQSGTQTKSRKNCESPLVKRRLLNYDLIT